MSEPHQARKRFGQNFLSDKNIIYKIIEAIRPRDPATAWSRSARAWVR
jgi:16S rRNA A1518/A1519 N6-dimethyltransferase RsmA/KsgA/DIM1 with predicted DNA glycosylase/AP lyase activity